MRRKAVRVIGTIRETASANITPSLALAEMKTLLVDVYSRFTTLPDESMTSNMMEMSDQLISSQPRGQKCLLHFVPLDRSY